MSDRPPEDAAGSSDAADPASGAEDRFRLVSATARTDASSRREVTVVLERRGVSHRGSSEGVGGPQVELRLAAEATMEAIADALGGTVPFRMVGVKSIHAFDGDLVLVGLSGRGASDRRFVGAVPQTEGPARAAAAAVLDALNRRLGLELPP